MDWLRRNWPDLAIGVALVAVIAGIIATLLTGGSFFPLAPTTGTTQAATPSGVPTGPAAPGIAVDPPTTPGVAVLPPGGGGAAPGAEAAAEGPEAADRGDDAADTPPPVDAPAAGAAPPAAPPIQPQAPAATPAPAAQAPAAPAPAAPAPAAPAPAAPAPAAPTPQAPAAGAPPAGPIPSAAADPEAPYRVAVGAFGNADNAARQAATFRDAGYPVFTGTQGALTIVLVGPYESEAQAAQVAQRIRGGPFGVDPVVYRFRPDAGHAAAATPAPGPTAAAPGGVAVAAGAEEAAPTPMAAAAPPAAAAAAPTPTAAGRYLQVGAYATVESLMPLRDRLAGLGYASTERREDGLIKVLVGPFDDAGLARARSHLGENGIDSFVR